MLNIILLGFTSLFADFSSEIILPLLPFFIESLGGAGLAIGLISGVGDAIAAMLKVVSGYFSDKAKNHKRFVILGYSFSAAAKFFYPLASVWEQILTIRLVERIGKGVRDAPRDAIVSESLDLKKRGEGFGLQRTMDSLGAILGSVTVLILIWHFHLSIPRIFFWAATIGIFSLMPLIFVKEPASLRGGAPRPKKSDFYWKGFPPVLSKFITVSTIFSLGNFSFMFLILKAAKKGLLITLFLYIFFNIFDAAFSRAAGRWSDQIGRKKIIMLAYLLLAITFGGFLVAKSFWVFLLLFSVYGLFKAFIDASQRSFISDLSPVEKRASALGAFEAATGLALIPGGLAAGFLWNINPQLTFIYGLGLTLISLALLAMSIKNLQA